MANNTKTTKKTETTKSTKTTRTTTSLSYFMNVLSYVAVCFGGVALFVTAILGAVGVSSAIIPVIQKFANAVAWTVVSILSFKFIKNRKKTWMWVVWTIAIVMIVLGIIL